jgi:pimeloyl-ACP methyl ester carboxylesterase
MSRETLHHEVVEAEGAGPWLLLLHGYLGMGRNLASLARRLAAGRPGVRPVLVDLPAHGRSPPPEEGGMETLALPVWSLVDELCGDDPVEVIGHSLGGRTAMAMDQLRPGRLEQATVLDVSPGGGRGGDGVRDIAEALAAAPERVGGRAEMREWLMGRGLSRPMADWLLMNLEREPEGGYAWRIDRRGLVERRDRWLGDDLWAAVEAPGSRVRRFVLGGASGFVSPEEVARLEAAGVRVQVLEGAGHFLHAEKPAELAELLRE